MSYDQINSLKQRLKYQAILQLKFNTLKRNYFLLFCDPMQCILVQLCLVFWFFIYRKKHPPYIKA